MTTVKTNGAPTIATSIHDLLSDYEPIGAAVPGGLIEFSWSDYRAGEKVLADLGLCNLLFMPR